jgi:SAM-dependent methyltransferase
MHALKYFPVALQWLADRNLSYVIDVGCGNGEFLLAAVGEHPQAAAFGVDLSSEAVSATLSRFRDVSPDCQFEGIVADAAAVQEWSQRIPSRGENAAITIWFVLHEFAAASPDPVVRFFEELHRHCPLADVIVAEIAAVAPHALASARHESIYPEMLLFHALSGQGILTWEDHSAWLNRIPYRLAAEERFDEIAVDGNLEPCTFIWHLSPNQELHP